MTQANFEELQPKVVLAVAAHPDDIDFGASGTMAVFAANGAAIHYLILTDGSNGTSDSSLEPSELVKMRQAEQEAALKCIGGTAAQFLNYQDGALEVTMQLKRDIVKVIRDLKPDVVVTMDPSVLYSTEIGMINHPDHRAAGQATLDAVFPLARDHLAFPELLSDDYQPHKVVSVLLINFNTSNYAVDISQTLPAKLAALKAHASQMPDFDRVEKLVKEIAETAGKAAGAAYAESFVRIDLS